MDIGQLFDRLVNLSAIIVAFGYLFHFVTFEVTVFWMLINISNLLTQVYER